MKHLFISILLSLLLVGCNESPEATSAKQEDVFPSDLTSEEEALLSDVRQMFQKDDVSVMMARVHKEGVEDWWMKIEKEYLEDVLEGGLGSLELVRVVPPRVEDKSFDGEVFSWSLPLRWELIVHQPSDDSLMNVSHTIALSEHDGRIVSIRKLSQGEQGGAEQPATAPELKSEGDQKPKPESEARPQ